MTPPASGENGSTPSPSAARNPRRLRAVEPVARTVAAPRLLERPAHNLPLELSSFVGREREVAEVKRLLTDTRLLTLTGPGGCGKTRLALAVASELVEDFEEGVWWVELPAAKLWASRARSPGWCLRFPCLTLTIYPPRGANRLRSDPALRRAWEGGLLAL